MNFPYQDDHLRHGGNLQELSRQTGIDPSQILDFSANINPAGPPPWLKEALMAAASRVGHYPDPDSIALREAASRRFDLSPDRFLFADGADSLLFALPLALGVSRCVIPTPSYSGYFRAARRASVPVVSLPLPEEKDFSLASEELIASLEKALSDPPSLNATQPSANTFDTAVFLGSPNNPAGGAVPLDALRDIAARNPRACFVIDESFIELSAGFPSLLDNPRAAAALNPIVQPHNVIAARSLTKAWAIPGARAGFLSGNPEILRLIRSQLPAWPLSCFAEEIAARCLADSAYLTATIPYLLKEGLSFASQISELGDIKIIHGGANFLLLDFLRSDRADQIHVALLSQGIAIRRYDVSEGLSPRYARIAVRSDRENGRFLAALRDSISRNNALHES
jgi:histidinol-phosphate/aromatic aminotransferase/cobyric acid decarboxylase-like protein